MAALLACGARRGPQPPKRRGDSGTCSLTQPQLRPCVTVPPERSAARPGIRIHRADVPRADVRRRERMPLTSPPRTILDLAGELGSEDLERLVAEADYRRLASERELREQLERNPGKRGNASAARRPRSSRRPGSHPLAGRAADASPASPGGLDRLRVEPANPRLRGGRAVAGAQLRGRDRRLRGPLRPARLRAGSAEGRHPEGSWPGRDAGYAPPASRRPGRGAREARRALELAGYRECECD